MNGETKARMTGLQAIITTPFFENGDINYDGLTNNTQMLIAKGVKWLTCTGTCGELASLTFDEYVQVIKTVCQSARGTDAIVVPGIGSSSLRTLIALANAAKEAGVHALMVIPPYYSPCKFSEAKAFFAEFAKNCRLPLQLYYYPQLHRMQLTLDQLEELLSMPCFAALKDTSCDIVTYSQVCTRMGDKINIITGAGEYLVPDIIMAGGKGFISSIVNYAPEIPLAIAQALDTGDYLKTAQMRVLISPLMAALNRWGSIDTIKKLMDKFGYCGGYVRLPELSTIKDEELEQLLEIIIRIKAAPVFLPESKKETKCVA